VLSGPRLRVLDTREPQVRSIAQRREGVRALLAFCLFVLLAGEVAFAFWGLLKVIADPNQIQALKDVVTMVLSPTVALVGAATGFYYGTRQDDAGDRSRNP